MKPSYMYYIGHNTNPILYIHDTQFSLSHICLLTHGEHILIDRFICSYTNPKVLKLFFQSTVFHQLNNMHTYRDNILNPLTARAQSNMNVCIKDILCHCDAALVLVGTDRRRQNLFLCCSCMFISHEFLLRLVNR